MGAFWFCGRTGCPTLHNKEAVNTKIERGLAQLDRGEGITGDKLRARLADDKAAWLKDKDKDRSGL